MNLLLEMLFLGMGVFYLYALFYKNRYYRDVIHFLPSSNVRFKQVLILVFSLLCVFASAMIFLGVLNFDDFLKIRAGLVT